MKVETVKSGTIVHRLDLGGEAKPLTELQKQTFKQQINSEDQNEAEAAVQNMLRGGCEALVFG